MSKKKEQEIAFEVRLDRLKEIVSNLEQGKIPLDQSIALYKEGLIHTQKCREELEKAQHEVQVLSQGQWEDFSVELPSSKDYLDNLADNNED